MDCIDVKARLVEYLDDGLPFEQARSIRSHLTRCYFCQEELDDVKMVLRTSQHALKHPNPRNRFDTLMSEIRIREAEQHTLTLRPKSPVRVVLGRLAAVVVIILAAVFAAPLAQGTRDLVEPYQNTFNLEKMSEPQDIRVPLACGAFVAHRFEITRRMPK